MRQTANGTVLNDLCTMTIPDPHEPPPVLQEGFGVVAETNHHLITYLFPVVPFWFYDKIRESDRIVDCLGRLTVGRTEGDGQNYILDQ